VEGESIQRVKRDPHNSDVLGIAAGNSINQLDQRIDVKSSLKIADAHSDQVLDFDYNSNKLHTLATSGADGAVRIWDLRKTDRCVL